MGPTGGYLSTINRQGSGARRTLLWTAIRLLAESGSREKDDQLQRPHVLLLDEPEICLHPNAIREASDLLYSLPSLTNNWQVMVTTHSPCFVDFARPHTSIVRVEQTLKGDIVGTTIFRPDKANFSDDDRELLKMMNICDPYVAEFFFGGHTIIVEGDTEFTAFKHIISMMPDDYKGIHIVRARGKATIVSLEKILNQFGTSYAVLHDSDTPTYQRDGETTRNPAWPLNESILKTSSEGKARVRVVASIPTFEEAYLMKKTTHDKPYNALSRLRKQPASATLVKQLLDGLIDFKKPLPQGAKEWTTLTELENHLRII
jgi:putative ATP-dependent endonuclease of OLD family